jgi:hypothetical protein
LKTSFALIGFDIFVTSLLCNAVTQDGTFAKQPSAVIRHDKMIRGNDPLLSRTDSWLDPTDQVRLGESAAGNSDAETPRRPNRPLESGALNV